MIFTSTDCFLFQSSGKLKNPWRTSSQLYGSFEQFEPHKIPLSHLPNQKKSSLQLETWRMTRTTASEYGNFYDESTTPFRREYKVRTELALPKIHERKPLPPIFRNQREVSELEDYTDDSTLKLPHIEDMSVQFTTRDYNALTVYPCEDGTFGYQTIPNRLQSIHLPEIRDVNISFRMRNGKSFNFSTSPRFSKTKSQNQPWTIRK